jgi:hypothetical protein
MDAPRSEQAHVIPAGEQTMETKMHAPYRLVLARIDDRSLPADHQQALVRRPIRDARAVPARLIRARLHRLLLRLGHAVTSACNTIRWLGKHSVARLVRWRRARRANG